MADSVDTKFKFEVKRNDQRTEKKSTKLFGPDDSNVFRKAMQDATKGNAAGESAPMATEQLHAIYISSVPDTILDKDLMTQHFSQYGKVRRVYISNVRKSVIVHFENHAAAKLAKTSGTELQGHKLEVFWSKSAKVSQAAGKKSPRSGPETRPRLDKQSLATLARNVEGPSVKPKYTLSDEVKEELKAMSGGEITKYEERPHTLASSTQALLKQKAPAVTRAAARGRAAVVRGASHTPTPQVSKPKLKAPHTSQASCAESLLALTKQQALTSEDRYKILEARDKLIRRMQSRGLMKRSPFIGTCPDMCPEKERYHRETTNQVAVYERLSSSEEVRMDHERAVKQYSRSSADQEDTLCHELRPATVLVRSMDYLRSHVMDCHDRDTNLQDWFHFLWDRTRSIRKDIAQQELCDIHCVALLEQCARFHIHCAEQLVAQDPVVFDQKINTENLTKSLQTLKYMYTDMALKRESCPCEAEFRAYMILLNLNDANFMWDLKQVPRHVLHSSEVQFALKVHTAIHGHNYIKFFKLVRQTTYLNACLLQRYFCQVRMSALLTLCKASCPGRARVLLPVVKLMKLLAFENIAETCEFLDCCGLTEYDNENKKCVVLYKGVVSIPEVPPQTYRAPILIESKMIGSLAEVVYGDSQSVAILEAQPVHSSFDENGYLKLEALGIGDVGDSGLFRVPVGEAALKRKKTSSVIVKAPEPGEEADVKEKERPMVASAQLQVTRTIEYSFSAAIENLTSSVAVAKPVFSFTLNEAKEETTAGLAVPMEFDTVQSVVEETTIAETVDGGRMTPASGTSDVKLFLVDEAQSKQLGVVSPAKQGAVASKLPTTPPDSPRQDVVYQKQNSEVPFSFSFDKGKSAVSSFPVSFSWKPQEEDEKKVRMAISLQTAVTNTGFSVSDGFLKREQLIFGERSGEVHDELTEAVMKQQKIEEQKKRMEAEEQKRKRLEEERRRIAAEKERVMLQRSHQVLAILLAEIIQDVCSTNLKEVQHAVQARWLLDAVINCVVEEHVTTLMAEALHNRRVWLLVKKVKERKMRVVCDKWRVFAARHKKRREAAQNFPLVTLLWSGVNDLYVPHLEHVSLLQLPDHSKCIKDMAFPMLDMCSLVGHRLLLRMNNFGQKSSYLFWKLVVSLPDSEESLFKQEANLWAHQMFTGKQHAKSSSKVICKTTSDIVCTDVQLFSCVTCVTGHATKETLQGMNGIVLWVASTMDDWTGVRHRLKGAVSGRMRLPPVPVVVVLVKNMARLTAGDIAEGVGMEDLVHEGYVSQYTVHILTSNSIRAILVAVEKAVQWLAECAPDPRPLVVEPLLHMVDQLVLKAFHQITSTMHDTVFASCVVQNPNNILYLYNKVLCALHDCLMDPQLAEYDRGAPEFSAISPQYEFVRPCPKDCATPHYNSTVTQVLKKLDLSSIQPWPPASIHELVQVLECYCQNNGLLDHWPLYSYLERAVEEYFADDGSPDDSSEWLKFLQSVDWTKVVEIIVYKKLESVQMLSSSEEDMLIAITKAKLSGFLDTFWWFTPEEIDKVSEKTPFTSSSYVAGEQTAQQIGDRKRRSASFEASTNSGKRRYREMTRGIDDSLAALKMLNEDIMKMLDCEPETTSGKT